MRGSALYRYRSISGTVAGVLQLPRTTKATVDVLRAIADADGPVWGLQVIRSTSRGPGTVYPILERLEQQGWLESDWEAPSDRRGPRRRLYRLSADGAESVHRAVQDVEQANRRPTSGLNGAPA